MLSFAAFGGSKVAILGRPAPDDLQSWGRDRVATDEAVIRVITVGKKKEKLKNNNEKSTRHYNRKEQPPGLLIIAITDFI